MLYCDIAELMAQRTSQAKCTLDEETRLVHMGPNTSYAELLEETRRKFPNAGPFLLKYLDRFGPDPSPPPSGL